MKQPSTVPSRISPKQNLSSQASAKRNAEPCCTYTGLSQRVGVFYGHLTVEFPCGFWKQWHLEDAHPTPFHSDTGKSRSKAALASGSRTRMERDLGKVVNSIGKLASFPENDAVTHHSSQIHGNNKCYFLRFALLLWVKDPIQTGR